MAKVVEPPVTDRECVFCGAPADSREHAFPRWLLGVLLDAAAGPSVAERFSVSDGAPNVHSWTTAAAANQTVRRVCHECNTGWMSQMEAKAKPLLEPMIRGLPQSLAPPTQIFIAAWAMKTFIALDEMAGSTHPVPEAGRRVVMTEERPPDDAWIFASGFDGEIGPLRFAHAAAHSEQEDGGPAEIDVYTLQMGALVLQGVVTNVEVASSDRWGEKTSANLPAVLQPMDFEVEVFPPWQSAVAWPQPVLLDDPGFLRYVQRMGGTASPFPPGSKFPTG